VGDFNKKFIVDFGIMMYRKYHFKYYLRCPQIWIVLKNAFVSSRQSGFVNLLILWIFIKLCIKF